MAEIHEIASSSMAEISETPVINIIPDSLSLGEFAMAARVLHPERTLRHYLSQSYQDGMPEANGSIATVLRAVLNGVQRISTVHGGDPVVNSQRIYFLWELWEPHRVPYGIRVAYHREQMQFAGQPDDPERPQVGLWGVGILAMEIGYGYLPGNTSPQELVTMGNNLMRVLTRINMTDGISRKKMIKKLPRSLQLLLDEECVNRLVKEVDRENAPKVIRWAKKALKKTALFFKTKEGGGHHDYNKSFSLGFLEVVKKCLDKENPTPISQILELPFFQNIPEVVVDDEA